MSAPEWPPWFYQPLSQHELPISNRAATCYGVIITFQVLAFLAVALRLYHRCCIAHAFGWDDILVLCALCTTTINAVLVSLAPKYGMGQHYGIIVTDDDKLIAWYKIYFFTTLLYFLSTTLIKISILFQYSYLFQQTEHRRLRLICTGLIGFVSIWGGCFFFIQLGSCSPISDAWSDSPTANCRLLMSFDLHQWLAAIIVHAVTNMILDYLILCLPIIFRRHLEIETRGQSALIALFTFGGCVATISAIRLILIIAYKGGVHPTQDASWHAPAIMIPSSVEIQAAVICASVPIFWPIVSKVLRLDQIMVTREVTLHSEARSSAPGLRGWKRHSESSETELRDLTSTESGNHSAPEVNESVMDSKDSYMPGKQVTDETILGTGFGHRVTTRSPSLAPRKNPDERHYEIMPK